MVTIRAALEAAKERIAPVSSSVSLDAQLLLGEILGIGRAQIIAYPERELTSEQVAQYDQWIERRAQGEPIAYILGRKAFYDRTFRVTPDVLIPRPETEHLLELALDFAGDRPIVAVDVGTGSGALAVTFKANTPATTVYAVDISPAALAVARQNASEHDTAITFFEGSLLEPLVERGVKVDLIMANLPYIDTTEMHDLAVSQHEPHLALDGGSGGLDLIEAFLLQVESVAEPGACILLEIGADQGEAVSQMAQERLSPQSATVIADYAGLDRVVKIIL